MNTLKNHVQLIGYLGADAEIRQTNKGKRYAQLRLATNEFVKTSSGEWKSNTQWHTLMVWGELTKALENYGKKGCQLLVQGTLQYKEYVDDQQIKRTIAEVRVNRLLPFQQKTKVSQNTKTKRKGSVEFSA